MALEQEVGVMSWVLQSTRFGYFEQSPCLVIFISHHWRVWDTRMANCSVMLATVVGCHDFSATFLLSFLLHSAAALSCWPKICSLCLLKSWWGRLKSGLLTYSDIVFCVLKRICHILIQWINNCWYTQWPCLSGLTFFLFIASVKATTGLGRLSGQSCQQYYVSCPPVLWLFHWFHSAVFEERLKHRKVIKLQNDCDGTGWRILLHWLGRASLLS